MSIKIFRHFMVKIMLSWKSSTFQVIFKKLSQLKAVFFWGGELFLFVCLFVCFISWGVWSPWTVLPGFLKNFVVLLHHTDFHPSVSLAYYIVLVFLFVWFVFNFYLSLLSELKIFLINTITLTSLKYFLELC